MNCYQLLYDGFYDALVNAALPVLATDKDAERAFLRLFQCKNAVVLLDFHNSIEPLIQEAEKGNKFAQYAYARWQCLDRGGENSLNISYRNMEAAAEQGLPDAIAGLAMTYEYGDIGYVNWEKAEELLEKAFAMGSELAGIYKIKNLLYGQHYLPAHEEEAAKLANELIAKDEAAKIEPNGWWYYLRACANEGHMGRTAITVSEDYRRALDLGVLDAYSDLIIAAGYGDDGKVLVETKEYMQYMNKGIERLCAGAMFLDAAREMKRYNTFEDLYKREDGIQRHTMRYNVLQQSHELIFTRLSHAAELADVAAWEQLGDCYYNGDYGFEQDYKKAFATYSNGTAHDSVGCVEKLWKMMHDHLIDRELDYVDQVALWGARWGSKLLLAETVIAHQEGRLEEYDNEISKYYEPIFDAPEFSLDNDEDWQGVIDDMLGDEDELEDDDGRYDAWA